MDVDVRPAVPARGGHDDVARTLERGHHVVQVLDVHVLPRAARVCVPSESASHGFTHMRSQGGPQ
jgi:hypothetical protein